MKHYIIDAHNLIHFDKKLNNILETISVNQARIELINLINPFAKKYSKYKITVVFDGVLENVFSSLENLYIVEAGRYKIADDVIKDYIRWDRNRKLCTVVSNDLEVIQYARLHDCNILKTENFIYELNFVKAGDINKKDIENVKIISSEAINAIEVDNLLKYFEDNPIDGSKKETKEKSSYSKKQKDISKVDKIEKQIELVDFSGLKNYFEKGISDKKHKQIINNNSISINSENYEENDIDEMMKLFNQI